MPEIPTQLVQATEAVNDDDPDTDAEFKSLYTDAMEGRDRFASLAKVADDAGHAEVAKVYREIGGAVMTLLMDMIAASGNALVNIETDLDDIPTGGAATESGLLADDAEKYLQLFDQYVRLLDGLTGLVPSGSEGDAQREVFATLRRMTEGMVEYTRSIIIEEEEDGAETEEEEPNEDA
jgi:hypothetical protein